MNNKGDKMLKIDNKNMLNVNNMNNQGENILNIRSMTNKDDSMLNVNNMNNKDNNIQMLYGDDKLQLNKNKKNLLIEKVIGIDKVHLTIYEYKFLPVEKSKFKIVPSCINSSGEIINDILLWYDSNNQPVYGKKAYYNSDTINLDYIPKKACFLIKFNPGKVINNNNYETVNIDDLKKALKKVESEIKENLGLIIKLEEAKISRLDIQVTLELKESIAPVFDALNKINVIAKLKKTYSYKESLCWKNTYKELCVYDKSEQCGYNNLSNDYKKAIRFEYRLTRSDAVKRDLGVKTISELTQSKINNAVLEKIKLVLDTAKPESCLSNYLVLHERLDSYRQIYGIKKIQEFFFI